MDARSVPAPRESKNTAHELCAVEHQIQFCFSLTPPRRPSEAQLRTCLIVIGCALLPRLGSAGLLGHDDLVHTQHGDGRLARQTHCRQLHGE